MPTIETKTSLESLIEDLGVSEEELEFWSSYEVKGIGQFYTEWTG